MSKKNILDYGCGLGGNSTSVARRGIYFGIDILSENIEYAKKRYTDRNFSLFNGKVIPFVDNYFNEVHIYDVLEHVGDFNNTLNEVNRVLNYSGEIFITVPAKISEVMLLKIKPDYFTEVGHVRIVDIEELKNNLIKKGFKVIKESKTRGVEALILAAVFFLNKSKKSVSYQTGSPRFSKILVASIWIFDTRLFQTGLKYLFFIYIFTLPIGWVISQLFPKTIYLRFKKND